jgi:hypothetical protein
MAAASDPKRHLRLVDPDTGEILAEPDCRTCSEWARKYHGLLSQMGQLRKDLEAEARADEAWPTAIGIFRYWQRLTGHERASFTPERFALIEPILRDAAKDPSRDGAAECRSAIRGLLASDYHLKRGRYARRDGPVYDEFWRPFATSANKRSQDRFEQWRRADPEAEADPTFAQQTLIEFANEIASRILERAPLIHRADDPVSVAQLLLEIDGMLADWRQMPAHGSANAD